MLVHGRVTPSIMFAGSNLYNWVERGTVKVKTTLCPWSGLERRLLDPWTSAQPWDHHAYHMLGKQVLQ